MLGKLSIRNAKRQAKDYMIYFITVILSAALMFSFNSIAASKDISELSSYMNEFGKAITGISILIIFVMAWLIHYTMKFMLEKRSKEFGTYQILGIEKKDIANMFTLENLVIGIVAFGIGILAGVFLYQVFTSIIMNLFQQPYQIKITFDPKAVGKTAIYFFGIFIIVLLNCRRKIQKTKVYDLLYATKQNENTMIQKSRGNVFLFILSFVLFGIALFLNHHEFSSETEMKPRNVFFAIVLAIVGIYLFYISISSFIVKRYLENKTKKYQKTNLFLYRNLTSKINTMSLTMGTIAMMFIIILIGGNVALLMNNMLNNEIEMGYPFEIMVSSPDGDFSQYKEYIEKNAQVKQMYEYQTYYDGNLYYMGLSDYNHLRKMLGHETVDLKDDEVMIHCLRTLKKKYEDQVKQKGETTIGDKKVKIKEVRTENFGQLSFNGDRFIFVVPDSLVDTVKAEQEIICKGTDDFDYNSNDFGYRLVVTTEESTDETFYNELCEFIMTKEIPMTQEIAGEEQTFNVSISLGNVMTKGKRMSVTKSFYTMVSFLAFYVALIFVMATATLLAIQQLSDSEKYKYRYALLRKLGVDELTINKTILKQLFYYFALPMLIPFVMSIPAILSIAIPFKIAVSMAEVWQNIVIIYSLFMMVYGIYFVATDVQFIRNIESV